MGRPRKDNPLVVISVRVEADVADRLAALSLETDRSHSELVRLVVALGLEDLEAERGAPPVAKVHHMPRRVIETHLWQSIELRVDPRCGLASVPRVVHDMVEAGVTVEAAVDALNLLAHQQRIELRPESGVGLLKPADASMCPRGMNNVPLSMLRIIRK